MEIRINGLHNFDESEQGKILDAVKLGGPVLNSNIFKLAVTYATYQEARGFTSSQIYQQIMNGADRHEDGTYPADGVMDLDLTGFLDSSTTIGWTTLWGLKTYFNKKFFKYFDAAELVGNITHEYMHKLGFTHNRFWGRQHSCPYAIGYMARDSFHEFYKSPGNLPPASGIVDPKLKISIVL